MNMKWKNQKGAALVEFALILPVLLLILLGIIEFGIIMFDKAIITNASREAAREIVNYKAPSEADVKDKILASYANLPITFGSDTLTADDIAFTSATNPTGKHWTASVSYTYRFLYSPIGSTLNLTSSTTMRQEASN